MYSSAFTFDWLFLFLAAKGNIHAISDEFEIERLEKIPILIMGEMLLEL